MKWDRDQVRLKIWSEKPGPNQTLLDLLQKKGFTANDCNVLSGGLSGNHATIQYGGAQKKDVDFIKSTICLLFRQQKDAVETNEAWADNDRDIYIRIPDSWAVHSSQEKSVLFFDPERGCHFTKSEKEFEIRKQELHKKGKKITRGTADNGQKE